MVIEPASKKIIRSVALLILCATLLAACTPGTTPIPSPAPSLAPTNTTIILPTSTVTPALASQPPATATVEQVFNGPLSVIITSPLDNTTVTDSPVQISGQADPGTVITLNEVVLLVDQTRAFSAQLPLENGANLIEITASDANNKQDFAYLTINYEPEP